MHEQTVSDHKQFREGSNRQTIKQMKEMMHHIINTCPFSNIEQENNHKFGIHRTQKQSSNVPIQQTIQSQRLVKPKSIGLQNQINNVGKQGNTLPKNHKKKCKSKKTTDTQYKTKEQNQATKQLLQHYHAQSIFQEMFQQKKQQLQKNQILQGWIKRNGSKKYFTQNNQRLQFLKQQNFKIDLTKINYKHELKAKTQATQDQNCYFVQPKNQKSHENCRQISSNQFLKDLKLKYAKTIKKKVTQQQEIDKTDNYINQNINQNCIKIEEENHDLNEQKTNNNQKTINNHQKKQYKKVKPVLSFKTITPRIKKKENSILEKSNLNKNISVEEEVKNRINHDGLKSRCNSRCQSALKSSRLKYQVPNGQKVIHLQKRKKYYNFKRNVTIDSSQLQKITKSVHRVNMDEIKSKKIVFQQVGKNKKQGNGEQINPLNLQQKNKVKNAQKMIHDQPQIVAHYRRGSKKAMKIRLKYLNNPMSTRMSNLNTIQTQNAEYQKMNKCFENNKISNEGLRMLKMPKNRQKIVGWEVRMSARGGEQFNKLRKLLRQEQQSYIYLPCEKQIKRKHASDHKIYLQSNVSAAQY